MIKKPNEIVQTDNIKIRMLIAGFPGIGKTTLGLSAPRPLLIDADFGAARVNPKHRKDTIQPDTYEELLEDLKPEILEEYETLVFDTGGALLELMKAYCIKQDPKNSKKDGALSLQGYGAVAKEFQRLMHMAYTQLKKHIVIIFHAKEEKDNDSTKLRILIEGQTKDTVWQSMDLGGFMEMQGSQRTIGFTNCEKYFAKGTCTGSFFTNVEVNIKKVRSNTVTSLIAVISMNVLFFLICALPMINNRFYKGSQN